MNCFTDRLGRTWHITLTIGRVKAAKECLGVDLLDGATIASLADDPLRFADMLAALCEAEWLALDFDKEEFCRGRDGDALGRAAGAIVGALTEFFPKPDKRAAAKEASEPDAEAEDQESPDIWQQIYELAGVCRINPSPLTLRELVSMARGAQMAEWSRTASQMALLANVNRDPNKGKAFSPDDFNPLAAPRKRQPIPKVPFSILKTIFIDKQIPREHM
jgi:hypothetical protein